MRFQRFLQKRPELMDEWTNGPMEGLTDQRMDTPSYRDAKTHLKMAMMIIAVICEEWMHLTVQKQEMIEISGLFC